LKLWITKTGNQKKLAQDGGRVFRRSLPHCSHAPCSAQSDLVTHSFDAQEQFFDSFEFCPLDSYQEMPSRRERNYAGSTSDLALNGSVSETSVSSSQSTPSPSKTVPSSGILDSIGIVTESQASRALGIFQDGVTQLGKSQTRKSLTLESYINNYDAREAFRAGARQSHKSETAHNASLLDIPPTLDSIWLGPNDRSRESESEDQNQSQNSEGNSQAWKTESDGQSESNSSQSGAGRAKEQDAPPAKQSKAIQRYREPMYSAIMHQETLAWKDNTRLDTSQPWKSRDERDQDSKSNDHIGKTKIDGQDSMRKTRLDTVDTVSNGETQASKNEQISVFIPPPEREQELDVYGAWIPHSSGENEPWDIRDGAERRAPLRGPRQPSGRRRVQSSTSNSSSSSDSDRTHTQSQGSIPANHVQSTLSSEYIPTLERLDENNLSGSNPFGNTATSPRSSFESSPSRNGRTNRTLRDLRDNGMLPIIHEDPSLHENSITTFAERGGLSQASPIYDLRSSMTPTPSSSSHVPSLSRGSSISLGDEFWPGPAIAEARLPPANQLFTAGKEQAIDSSEDESWQRLFVHDHAWQQQDE
jgi:hypothetical protein